MEDTHNDDEKLLNLTLAIVTNSRREKLRKKKRSPRDDDADDDDDIENVMNDVVVVNNKHPSYSHEGKIFRLLHMREQMLKQVAHHNHHHQQVGQHQDEDNEDAGKAAAGGLHLIQMLLITATAVNENNMSSAVENLTNLYKSVSLCGDSVQRVVAYMADGLAARILTRKSPFYDMIMKEPTAEEEFVAFTALYRVSPYSQFAHFTANQAIIEAFEKEEDSNNRALHVIDFDVSYGFQWPSLIQSLSEKATSSNRISLRITGFGRSLDELRETERRLTSFSKGFCNLVFEFQGLLRGCSQMVSLRRKRNETIAVNFVLHLNMKISESLKSLRLLNPSIVMLVEEEGSKSPQSFLSRFIDSLHFFAAMFDSLNDCFPLESAERLSIEKNHLGKAIKTMLNYDESQNNYLHNNSSSKLETMETWKARMESHGFQGMSLSSKSKIQARLLLKIRTHYCPQQFDHGESSGGGGCAEFKVFERDDGRTISLGWQDRYLLTISAWHCRIANLQ